MHCASVYMHIKLGISYSLYAYKRQKIALVIPLCIYLRSYGRTYNLLTNGPDDLTNLGLHARGASKSQHNTTQLIVNTESSISQIRMLRDGSTVKALKVPYSKYIE